MESRLSENLIGITGGIGSGKSMVARICRLGGLSVYDCDSRAKELRDSSSDVCGCIAAYGHEDVFGDDGKICDGKLRDAFFRDRDFRNSLSSIIHREVLADILEVCNRCRQESCGPVFVESAIFNTSGLTEIVSGIWLVSAPEDLRLRRVKERSGISSGQIRRIMEAQREDMDFSRSGKPVSVISNDGRVPLVWQVKDLLESIRKTN